MQQAVKTFLVFYVVSLGAMAPTSAFALETQGEPSAEDYKHCGELVLNAHSLFEHPEAKVAVLIHATKLFDKWSELSGITLSRAEQRRMVKKSFDEFDSEEKFNSTYTEQEQEFCHKLSVDIDKTAN